MHRTVFSLLLAASLLVNGFFLAGYWFAGSRAGKLADRKHRIQAVVEQLDLTEGQKQLFRQLRAKAFTVRKPYMQRMRELKGMLWEEMVNGSAEHGRIEEIIHEMALEREKYQKEIAAIVQEFLRGLSPEQKKRFLELSQGKKVLSALISG